jgi:hypothetical protein
LLDRRFRHRPIGVFHEGESSRAAGFPVQRPYDLRRLTDGREMDPQVFFGGLVREITYE